MLVLQVCRPCIHVYYAVLISLQSLNYKPIIKHMTPRTPFVLSLYSRSHWVTQSHQIWHDKLSGKCEVFYGARLTDPHSRDHHVEVVYFDVFGICALTRVILVRKQTLYFSPQQ